jgi:hypothetical protein
LPSPSESSSTFSGSLGRRQQIDQSRAFSDPAPLNCHANTFNVPLRYLPLVNPYLKVGWLG